MKLVASPPPRDAVNDRMKLIPKFYLTGLVLVVLAIFAALSWAAQDRAIASPDRLASVAGTLGMDLNGTTFSFPLRFNFHSIDARPSGEVTSIATGSVEVDLIKGQGSVVVGGVQYEYAEAAAILAAIADREWKIAHPSALPQRRRALRSGQ